LLELRPGVPADLPALVAIYNHYVENTPITFDVETFTLETRRAWFERWRELGADRCRVAPSSPRRGGSAAPRPAGRADSRASRP
jgi:phosphinothricin acetyltransferase